MTRYVNPTPMVVEPVTLEGRFIRLESISWAHYEGLCQAGSDPDIWRWTTSTGETPEKMRAYIETALKWQAEGHALPFDTIEKVSGRVVGSTRFGNIDKMHHRVEIGWTWINPKWQRSAANTEAKFLMLRHAFETLGCIRVELKTDVLNEFHRQLQAVVKRVAEREGYTLVFDKGSGTPSEVSSLLYAKETLDVTEKVLDELDKESNSK